MNIFVKLLFVCVFILSHSNIFAYRSYNIDELAQNYITAEKYLWQLIYSTDRYNRIETLDHIYNTHEEHLGYSFGELGLFEQLHIHLIEHKLLHRPHGSTEMIENVLEINATALNVYRLLNHQFYSSIQQIIEDVLKTMNKMLANISKTIDNGFWSWAIKVSRTSFIIKISFPL